MDKLNHGAVAYIVSSFHSKYCALTPVAIVVAQNNTTMDTNTTTGVENTTQAQGLSSVFYEPHRRIDFPANCHECNWKWRVYSCRRWKYHAI